MTSFYKDNIKQRKKIPRNVQFGQKKFRKNRTNASHSERIQTAPQNDKNGQFVLT